MNFIIFQWALQVVYQGWLHKNFVAFFPIFNRRYAYIFQHFGSASWTFIVQMQTCFTGFHLRYAPSHFFNEFYELSCMQIIHREISRTDIKRELEGGKQERDSSYDSSYKVLSPVRKGVVQSIISDMLCWAVILLP
jgi:hypothetical protein